MIRPHDPFREAIDIVDAKPDEEHADDGESDKDVVGSELVEEDRRADDLADRDCTDEPDHDTVRHTRCHP